MGAIKPSHKMGTHTRGHQRIVDGFFLGILQSWIAADARIAGGHPAHELIGIVEPGGQGGYQGVVIRRVADYAHQGFHAHIHPGIILQIIKQLRRCKISAAKELPEAEPAKRRVFLSKHSAGRLRAGEGHLGIVRFPFESEGEGGVSEKMRFERLDVLYPVAYAYAVGEKAYQFVLPVVLDDVDAVAGNCNRIAAMRERIAGGDVIVVQERSVEAGVQHYQSRAGLESVEILQDYVDGSGADGVFLYLFCIIPAGEPGLGNVVRLHQVGLHLGLVLGGAHLAAKERLHVGDVPRSHESVGFLADVLRVYGTVGVKMHDVQFLHGKDLAEAVTHELVLVEIDVIDPAGAVVETEHLVVGPVLIDTGVETLRAVAMPAEMEHPVDLAAVAAMGLGCTV